MTFEFNNYNMAYLDAISYMAGISGARSNYISNLIKLFDEGATIPFIARYRKEMTGAMDEVKVGEMLDLYKEYKELEARKKTVLDSIEQQGVLTDKLQKEITECTTLRRLEDIYLPYKPKRQTRATKAREKGLEPLAARIMKQGREVPEDLAEAFLTDDVESVEEALQGARDIIAEWVNESEVARNRVRQITDRDIDVVSKVVKGKESEGEKFTDYFDFREPLRKTPSHRLLALKRGENEGFLRVSLVADDEVIVESLDRIFVKGSTPSAKQIKAAVADGYKRLLFPAIETEQFGTAKEKADTQAIKVFTDNLEQLLLAAPLGNKRILAIDPGFRTGCKVVCLDETGNLLHNATIYPHAPQKETAKASSKLMQLVESYKIDAIAIGNGTASRETENLVKNAHFYKDIDVFVVNEAGASVYSASKIAREEFPEYDVTVRGAVSIGRRLMDPLAELVKIDPKSIGVGQYQHDVDQNRLKDALERVVESCVNRVGVNVNYAGRYLLSHISGVGMTLAQNIEEHIRENGPFKSRKELLKVKRMGPKSYEQCAGFLRIDGGNNPLDNSAVHPESYPIVERMAKDLGVNVKELIGNESLCNQIVIDKYITPQCGEITLKDIIDELRKPNRDPRKAIAVLAFDERLRTIDDVKEGMIVPGVVNNMTNFGAFVDIGIKQGGLLHVSQMAERFISNPSDVVALHQHLMVKVVSVDKERKRIGLSLIGVEQ
ncbi:MAG: Tex family protein [Marinifilaceae bacterium]